MTQTNDRTGTVRRIRRRERRTKRSTDDGAAAQSEYLPAQGGSAGGFFSLYRRVRGGSTDVAPTDPAPVAQPEDEDEPVLGPGPQAQTHTPETPARPAVQKIEGRSLFSLFQRLKASSDGAGRRDAAANFAEASLATTKAARHDGTPMVLGVTPEAGKIGPSGSVQTWCEC